MVVVETSPGKRTAIETVPLTAGRPLVEVKGTLEQIRTGYPGVGDAWLKAIVELDEPAFHLADTLAKYFPAAQIVAIEERNPHTTTKILNRSEAAEELPGTEEMFREYLDVIGIGGPGADHMMSSLADLMAIPDPEDVGPCCEEQLLSAAIAGTGIEDIDTTRLLIAAPAAGSNTTEGQQR